MAEALCKKANQFIRFPQNNEEINAIKTQFYRLKRFPHVIGAIDCTHVEILSPKKDIEVDYVNRKGRHSINVQVIRMPPSVSLNHFFN